MGRDDEMLDRRTPLLFGKVVVGICCAVVMLCGLTVK